jgi:hypothetical protein
MFCICFHPSTDRHRLNGSCNRGFNFISSQSQQTHEEKHTEGSPDIATQYHQPLQVIMLLSPSCTKIYIRSWLPNSKLLASLYLTIGWNHCFRVQLPHLSQSPHPLQQFTFDPCPGFVILWRISVGFLICYLPPRYFYLPMVILQFWIWFLRLLIPSSSWISRLIAITKFNKHLIPTFGEL